jgi:hypothetical protein
MAEKRVGSPYLRHDNKGGAETPEEEERRLTDRFRGSLEEAGAVLKKQPGRLLRAQQIGERRLRSGTQKALASQMGTGPLGAGQVGAVADVGATRGLAEAEYGLKAEQAISDAAFRAAQGDAEIASALQAIGDSAKIREIGTQVAMLRAAGASDDEVREYINMELAATGSVGTRQYLEGRKKEEEEDLGFGEAVSRLAPGSLIKKGIGKVADWLE